MEAGTATCWRQQASRHSRHLQRGLQSLQRAKRTGSLLPGQQDQYRPPTVQKQGHRRTTRAPRDLTQGKAQQPHAGRRARSLTRFTTITRIGEPARGGGPDRVRRSAVGTARGSKGVIAAPQLQQLRHFLAERGGRNAAQ